MFQQLQIPELATIGAVIALLVTFAGFVAIVVATLRCPKKKIEKLENLPWQDDKAP
ncbi:MAG: hypothetical protein IAE97_14440 [Chthoniobacterales bacterium]|nr:hypothetical protein [Chthoniobacterales bacterium]